jgi:hypothetical protein
VITKIEPDLFETVTGLTVKDFHLLVQLRIFNTERMNEAVFAFRRYEDASLRYTGIESHQGLRHYGLYNTIVAKEDSATAMTAQRHVIEEHDCVTLLTEVTEDGVRFPAGTVGTIISVYEEGRGYAVELEPPAGNPVIATLLAHQVKAAR